MHLEIICMLKTVSSSYSYGVNFGGPSISWNCVSSSNFDTITTHALLKLIKEVLLEGDMLSI